ncbi:MAG: GNAT family N-acetyltransferase [Frankia sp.]
MPEALDEKGTTRNWHWPGDLTAYHADLIDMLAESVTDDGILGYASPLTADQGAAFYEDLRRLVSRGDGLLLIGEDTLGVFGMCWVAVSTMPNCRHVAEVSKAYLKPRVRRTGAVIELVVAVCDRMLSDGVERLRIDVRENSPAHRVWETFGFQTFGVLEDYSRIDGIGHRGHFMTHSVAELGESAQKRLAGRVP